MEKITLEELIDVETLQKIQDGFSKYTGFAALTTDASGKEITKGSNFSDYCMNHIRKSPKGRKACQYCDRYGAEKTLETGKPMAYVCHSGLTDFSAPIVAKGEVVGCFIGGQILSEKPDREYIDDLAQAYDLDADDLWESINKVPIIPHEKVDNAAEFLSMISSTLSDMAYSRIVAKDANEEIISAANMKSNFLANMSHEIRTPMNAVIGMAEMAMREEMSPVARDYINQIKTSGKALLGIINDILDYSKIESGKMDILPVEYDPLSLCSDVANIVMTKLKDNSKVELLLSANPKMPRLLYGDNIRIRQILINLANNAVKFTKKGYVDIKIDFETIDDDHIKLVVVVKDTGIGIKENDMKKLFNSFQQVDSKRNRNVEGTGLGLAISKNLLTLMDGTISVESEYEKGSIFSFELPQKVVDWERAVVLNDAVEGVALGFWTNKALARHFYKDTKALRVFSYTVISPDRFNETLNNYQDELAGKTLYFFFDEKDYCDEIGQILDENSNLIGIMSVGFYSKVESDRPNLRIVKKPLSTLSIAAALNNQEVLETTESEDSFVIDFTAPDARVMVVDDNEVNLTVAKGLLEPLNMQVITSLSGRDAISILEKEPIDMVFMDHMMPEMDGVETTRVIRRLYPQCAEMPIIALTANAVEGTKEMFLSEGMNDFVAKPIELATIISKIKQWLPIEKIKEGRVVVSAGNEETSSEAVIVGDLDTASAIQMLGSVDLFWTILKEYYKSINTKASAIRRAWETKDWPTYTIEVHALKSTSRQIGITGVAAMAAELEKAGNSRDINFIDKCTEGLLQDYLRYEEVLAPFCKEEEKVGAYKRFDLDDIKKLLSSIEDAVENLDTDSVEEALGQISAYELPPEQSMLLENLVQATDNMDFEMCEAIVSSWKALCE